VAATVWIDSTPALAQGQTGTIAGVVRDSSGAVLPGVTVEASSPALIEKTRSAVTDGQGAYKIIDLRPGTYSVSFSLAGFSTVRREDITLTASFTANVNADLRVGALEETVTVTGSSPIVDTQNVAKITTTREVMDVLPPTRNFVSLRRSRRRCSSPACVRTSAAPSPTGMNLVVHGSRRRRQPGHGGRHADYQRRRLGRPAVDGNLPEQCAGAGITFQTDSHNAEFEARQRLLELHPEGRLEHLPRLLRHGGIGEAASANLDDEQKSKGLLSGSRINRIWDLNPALGGPLVKDRVWIYGSYGTGAPTTRWPARSVTRTSRSASISRPPNRTSSPCGTRPARRGSRRRSRSGTR
jgi:hypothetical protein